jgi:hypothetical protein
MSSQNNLATLIMHHGQLEKKDYKSRVWIESNVGTNWLDSPTL